MTFGPKGSDLKKSILKSRKGYLKVRFLGILHYPINKNRSNELRSA